MAYASLLRRATVLPVLATMLVACSPDGLVPPSPIDGGTRVGSIGPARNAAPQQRSQPQIRQPAPARFEPAPADASQQRLPMIDSDEAMAETGGGDIAIPDEGVNIDAGLGVVPDSGVIGLAEEQDAMIAEGSGSQPVIGGIGTENPMLVHPGNPAPPAIEAPRSDSPWSGLSSPQRSEAPRQVAMLRPANPVSRPDVAPSPQTPWQRQAMPRSEVNCRAELRRLGVGFEDIPPINGGPGCGIAHPVRLSGLSGGIAVKPAVALNCQITLAFARWVKADLAPSARMRYLSGVRTIETMGGYSCRRMNNSRQRNNPMSEHARGNAIDVGSVTLKSGKKISVRAKSIFSLRERGLLNAVRGDSCKYFSTVLGPGSNAEHWDHFHFDLRSRKSGSRHCD